MITQATQSDLPALVPLLRELNGLHAENLPRRFHQSGSNSDLLEVLRTGHVTGTRFLIYKTEGVVRGYLAWVMAPRGKPGLEHPQTLALLDHIYVEPILRRRGVASRLIARFEADISALGAEGWTVRVHSFNRASAALMERHGAQLSVQSFTKLMTAAAGQGV